MLLLLLSPTMLKWGFVAMSLLSVVIGVAGDWTPSTARRQWHHKQKHTAHCMTGLHPYIDTRYLSPQLLLSPPRSPLCAQMGFRGHESHVHVLQDCGRLTHQNHRWRNKQKKSLLSAPHSEHFIATFNLILPPASLFLALQLHSLADKNVTLHLVPKLWFSCATYVDWQTMMPVKR